MAIDLEKGGKGSLKADRVRALRTFARFRPPIPLQLDGELLALDPGTPVCIDIAPAALATLG